MSKAVLLVSSLLLSHTVPMAPAPDRRTVYGQIADHLRTRILAGDFGDGEPIPSLTELVADWGVSVMTARRAVAVLAGEGLVEIRPGLTTVAVTPRTVPAPRLVADELGVEQGELVRVRTTGHAVTFTRMSG